MISNLWTISVDGGSAQTLAEWGVERASISFRNMDADTLSLDLSPESALASVAYDAEIVLSRGDEVFFRGWVTGSPVQFSGSSEAVKMTVENVWRKLLDVDYQQLRTVWAGQATAEVFSTRYRLGENPAGGYVKTWAMLGQVASYANSRGIAFALDLSSIPNRTPGLIEGDNQSIGQVIRQIMGSHPESILAARYTETGTILELFNRGTAGSVDLDLAEADRVTDFRCRSLDDRQVDGVILQYEAVVESETIEAERDGLARTDRTPKLAIFVDDFPTGKVATSRTLVQTLPAPGYSLASRTPPDVQWVRQAIVTRPLPRSGETDEEVQKWWFRHADALASVGLTEEDLLIAAVSTDEVRAHKITLLPQPEEDRPSPINPNSTPLFSPPEIDDYPRELIEGQITDWMGVTAASVVAEVTIGVRKSVVDALDATDRAKFLRLGPRELSIEGNPTYALDRTVTVRGTDARTKVYAKPVSVNFSGLETQDQVDAKNLESYGEAFAAAVIPGLAGALFSELSVLAYEGNLTLTEAEAGEVRYLGQTLNVIDPDHPQWASMSAQIQGEDLDLVSAETRLTFGPPEHLSIADRKAMHAAARMVQDRRKAAATYPAPGSTTANVGAGGIETDAEGSSVQQIGGSIGPINDGGWDSGGTTKTAAWDIIAAPETEGSSVLFDPTIIKSLTDLTGRIDVTVAPFVSVAGRWLVAEIVDFDDPAVVVKLLETWTGYPSAYEFEVISDVLTLVTARLPLYHFQPASEEESETEFTAVKIVPSRPVFLRNTLIAVESEAKFFTRSVPYFA